MNQQANYLFTKIFINLTTRRSEIHTFRKLVELGLPYALTRRAADNLLTAQQILEGDEFDTIFLDKQGFVAATGGAEAMGRQLTESDLGVLRVSADAASLVFMHSALDAAAHDCCRVCALVRPQDWEPFLSQKKIALSEVKSTDYATIFQQRLTAHLTAFERESLLTKIDRLFALCQPPTGFVFLKKYSFDRDRLEGLDVDRHAIIHGTGVALTSVGDALDFLRDTGLFLLGLINHRYDVRIDPTWVQDHMHEGLGWGKLRGVDARLE